MCTFQDCCQPEIFSQVWLSEFFRPVIFKSSYFLNNTCGPCHVNFKSWTSILCNMPPKRMQKFILQQVKEYHLYTHKLINLAINFFVYFIDNTLCPTFKFTTPLPGARYNSWSTISFLVSWDITIFKKKEADTPTIRISRRENKFENYVYDPF